MVGFIKKILSKIISMVLVVSLFGCGANIYTMWQKRNLNSDPAVFAIDAVQSPGDELVYVTVEGGFPDITETYEYGLVYGRGNKDPEDMMTSDYYVPMLSKETDKPVYILKNSKALELTDLVGTQTYSGALKASSELPEELAAAYAEAYPGAELLLLDTTIKPGTFFEQLKLLLIFLGVSIIAWRMLKALRPAEEVSAEDVQDDELKSPNELEEQVQFK